MSSDKKNPMESTVKSFINEYKKFNEKNAIEKLKDSINKIRTFYSLIFRYIIISSLIFAAIAVVIYFIFDSAKVAITFFITSIPVIIGIGLSGFQKSVSNLVTGTTKILDYILELVSLYYEEQTKNDNKNTPSLFCVVQVVFSDLILPLITDLVSGIFFSKLIIFSISKAVQKLCQRLKKSDKDNSPKEMSHSSLDKNLNENSLEMLSKINKIRNFTLEKSNNYLAKFRMLMGILSFLCIVLGIAVIAIVIIVSNLIMRFF